MPVRSLRIGVVLLAAIATVACRDPESGTNYGPTKKPGAIAGRLTIGDEEPTAMRALGTPIRPRGEPLQMAPVDTTAAAAQAAPRPQVTLPAGVTQQMVDEGQQIFHGAGACFGCHGQNGGGGPLAPKLADTEWLHIDGSMDALVQVITTGVPQPKQFPAPMPPKGGSSISDAQVRSVAAYVYSISR